MVQSKDPAVAARQHAHPRLAFAIGGLAGNNAHGAGFLQAALDAEVVPALISCTSGQLLWVKYYLEARRADTRTKPAFRSRMLREKLEEWIQSVEPFPQRDWDLLLLALAGKREIFRLAWPEWPIDYCRNMLKGAVDTIQEWWHPFVMQQIMRTFPARSLVPQFSQQFFEAISDEFNGCKDIGILFNSYDPGQGIEIVHVNPRARQLLGVEPGSRKKYRDRTIYKEITPGYVRDALWLYEYGFEGDFSALDGCYYRQIMLSELSSANAIFVARPLNTKWVHELPSSYIEREDLKTEVSLNGIYAGEREKILTINKLRDENVALQEKYHHIELVEIELGVDVQRGFYDYVFEDPNVFEAAYGRTMQHFRASKYARQAAAA
jgi:PAS domain-containing protein